MSTKTLGETIVRTDFNASGSGTVASLKNEFARMIDNVNSLNRDTRVVVSEEDEAMAIAELARLKQNAIDALELAAMFAVKAATL